MEHEKTGYLYPCIHTVSRCLIICVQLPLISVQAQNVEKPGSGFYMQQYPVFYWSTPTSISSFLKTKMQSYPGFRNQDIVFCTNHNMDTPKPDHNQDTGAYEGV